MLRYVRNIEQHNWTVINMAKLKDVNKIKTVSTYSVRQAGKNSWNKNLPQLLVSLQGL